MTVEPRRGALHSLDLERGYLDRTYHSQTKVLDQTERVLTASRSLGLPDPTSAEFGLRTHGYQTRLAWVTPFAVPPGPPPHPSGRIEVTLQVGLVRWRWHFQTDLLRHDGPYGRLDVATGPETDVVPQALRDFLTAHLAAFQAVP